MNIEVVSGQISAITSMIGEQFEALEELYCSLALRVVEENKWIRDDWDKSTGAVGPALEIEEVLREKGVDFLCFNCLMGAVETIFNLKIDNFKVTVTRLVPLSELSEIDLDELVIEGSDLRKKGRENFHYRAYTREQAEELFHDDTPIHNLDDFKITVRRYG